MTTGAVVLNEFFQPMLVEEVAGETVRLRHLRRKTRCYIAEPRTREERRAVVERWRSAPPRPVSFLAPKWGWKLSVLAAAAAAKLDRDVTLREAAGWVAKVASQVSREISTGPWSWSEVRRPTPVDPCEVLEAKDLPLEEVPAEWLEALSELNGRLYARGAKESPAVKEVYAIGSRTVAVPFDSEGQVIGDYEEVADYMEDMERGRWVATLRFDENGEVAGCRCCGTADAVRCPQYGKESCRLASIY